MKKQYTTPARRAVLSLFQSYPHRHFTAEQVCTLVCQTNEQGTALMGKSTVYRQIAKLWEDGIIRRFESANCDSFVYQYAVGEGCDHHFHLKCARCGKLIHMECDKLQDVREHILKDHGFLIGGASVIYGVCAACTESH